MGKTCKYHKLLLIKEFVFCDNPKAYGKILLGFSLGNKYDAKCRLAHKVMSNLHHSFGQIQNFANNQCQNIVW